MHTSFSLPFGIELQAYGSMAALGTVLAYAMVVRGARELRVREYEVACFFLASLGAAMLGARVGYVILGYLGDTRTGPFAPALVGQGAGFSSLGAVVALGLFCPLYLVWRKLPALDFLALATPAAALGLAMTRLGCLAEGCCQGTVSSVGWAIAGRHPVAAYEALALLMLAAGLGRLLAARVSSVRVLAVWLLGVSSERFAAQFWRAEAMGLMTPTHLAAAALALAAVALLLLSIGREAAGRRKSSCGAAGRRDGRMLKQSGIRRLAPSLLDETTVTVEVEMPTSS